MAMTLTPMTELDAVNMMLISIGQAPVNTLAVSGIRDVSIAQTILDNTNREVQGKGWHFNTDYNYELVPDGSNNVLVPAAALAVDPVYTYQDFVVRDNGGTRMLYDREDQTFTITLNPVKVHIVWVFDFDEIPQPARNYIAVRAARRFQAYSIGSQILHEYTSEDELDALGTLKSADLKTRDVNILNDGDYTNQIFLRRLNP